MHLSGRHVEAEFEEEPPLAERIGEGLERTVHLAERRICLRVLILILDGATGDGSARIHS